MIAIDSEFQSLIPPLSDDEYQRLENSILTDGYHEWEPIVTWNGTIVDGHNRYHICDEHGIKPTQVEREFDSRDAAKIWIIEHQFGRRNLSKYDRSVLALQLEPLYAAEAKRRQSAAGGDHGNQHTGGKVALSQISDEPPTRTDEQLAKIAGTSRDTIRKVKVIETEAAKGNETAIEAKQAVLSGEKSIHKAFTEIRPKICTVCGKPIINGDCYSHDQNKHKACASTETELNRGKRGGRKAVRVLAKPEYTEDGRRVCSICGKPIEPGTHYQDKLGWHYKCGLERETENQRKYRDADRDLRENVPTYTKESLISELTSSVDTMRQAIQESITINESMGVSLSNAQKKRLIQAIKSVYKSIQDIKR